MKMADVLIADRRDCGYSFLPKEERMRIIRYFSFPLNPVRFVVIYTRKVLISTRNQSYVLFFCVYTSKEFFSCILFSRL